MNAPKPGDRVRLTFTANVYRSVTYGGLRVLLPDGGPTVTNESAPLEAFESAEVLASPVYVNSDTTEYLIGDLVKDRRGDLWLCAVDDDQDPVWKAATGLDLMEEHPDAPLTLLYRFAIDQVVQP